MPQDKNNSKRRINLEERDFKKPQNAYFASLELKNIRCFSKEQKIKLSSDRDNPKQWTIILGNNGTGKTTILQSLVSLTPVPVFGSQQFYPEVSEFITSFPRLHEDRANSIKHWKPFRESENESFIKATFSMQDLLSELPVITNIELSLWAKGKSYWEQGKGELFNLNANTFAYGASRKAGETSLSEKDDESAYRSLFDETALLINPEEWLIQADYFVSRSSIKKSKEDFRRVKEILIKVLPDIDNIRFREKRDEEKAFPTPTVEFHTPYGWVESRDLSLGYRTSMAWIVDFVSRMFNLYPESENPLAEPAVVLIDEIDLHLHPKWQRELIDYLTNLFPNTQFIVTTHSPLIVQAAAARNANIVVCRREGDHIVIDQSVEAVKNWRADQILTSDLFDLPTARAKDIEPFLEERKKILSKAKLTKRDEKRLEELEKEIGSVPVMENPKYDEAMDIILRAAEKLGKENGASNDSHQKASKNSRSSKK